MIRPRILAIVRLRAAFMTLQGAAVPESFMHRKALVMLRRDLQIAMPEVDVDRAIERLTNLDESERDGLMRPSTYVDWWLSMRLVISEVKA